MAYTNFQNCTANEYKNIIYSQDSSNRIRIWFNNIEVDDADEYCVSLESTDRILPDDGSKRFSIENFVAEELTLILRDLPNNVVIQDQVKISIGTLVGNNTYEDVPIGIFNIQDQPETDKNKVTIKLRDNRVKFDFNYNAKPLIDELGGVATYEEILNDICTQAGVVNNVGTFNGSDIEVSIYDNTIQAMTYVAYILGQSGYIPTIDRYGNLIKIDLSNLTVYRIPLSIVEKYEIGTPYLIERVVYESGIIKYQSSNDETLSTLYLDSANPYISSQNQIDYIYNLLKNFEIDSVTTGKILGNPAIDSYDIIEIYDDEEVNEPVIFRTLANNTLKYNGKLTNTFDTQIGLEQRTENVSISSDLTFRKTAKTEIDNVNVAIKQMVEQINGVEEYVLTEDTTFQANKTYYILSGGSYIEYTNYEVGDEITGDIYEAINDGLIQRIESAESVLDTQGQRLDIVSKNIDPKTGDVLALKRTNYEFGQNGIIISGQDGYKAIRNTIGDYFYENETMLRKDTKDGSVVKDMALFGKYYYGVDEDVNVAKFSKDKAMFVAQLYEKNGEKCFGHFYNGN